LGEHLADRDIPRPLRRARGRRKHVIMDKAELLSYIRARRLAVIGTIGPDGSPQGALVGVAVTDGFQIIFDTVSPATKLQERF
jgi:hypothetical protein